MSIVKGNIKYKLLKQTNGYRDFFTEKEISDWYDNYKISLSYWKRNMYDKLLFSTNDLSDAINFYDTYEDIIKYNL